ncbi:unnamed protein product [Brachionus calyciflorus]|uniref:G-protein coupled receptors family 1 profile domain-containing protein n=1 Tax=Brachionus calyciflorus TaxID=104777 RepID=A0A813NG08_9BILA|nr:unnamed protein product [Brachionus calyciflorus]
MNDTNVSYMVKKRLMDRTEIKILFGVLMGALCVITTVGNIAVIYKYRKASRVGNLFIMSLAFADLIVGLFVMPVATLYAITEVWTMTLPVCLIWLSADYTASTASILNLLTLSLDRYWSITSPLEYLGKRTKSRALIMIGLAWSISLLWLLPITGWPYFFNNGIRMNPIDKCNTEYDKNILFKVTTAIINFYIPLIAMIAINTKIYIVIHKRYRNPIMKYSAIMPHSSTILNQSKPKSYSLALGDGQSLFPPKKNSKLNLNIFTSIKEINNLNLIIINNNNDNDVLKKNNSFFKKSKSVENLNLKDLNKKEINSDSKCHYDSNSSEFGIDPHHHSNKIRSVLTELQAVRRIPDNSVKIKRLVYRDSKFIQPSISENNQESMNGRMSPLFYRLPKLEQNVNIKNNNSNNVKQRIHELDKVLNQNKKQTNRLNRKGFMNKQEKAFKQLSSIVIGFTLCFLPYFIVFLIVAICEDCVSNEVFTVTLWLGYFNSTMNPFLYALSNKRNKKEIHKSKYQTTTTTSDFLNHNNNNRKSFRRYVQNERKSVW